jgi:hypothetical protein
MIRDDKGSYGMISDHWLVGGEGREGLNPPFWIKDAMNHWIPRVLTRSTSDDVAGYIIIYWYFYVLLYKYIIKYFYIWLYTVIYYYTVGQRISPLTDYSYIRLPMKIVFFFSGSIRSRCVFLFLQMRKHLFSVVLVRASSALHGALAPRPGGVEHPSAMARRHA